jgi:hypothetical protein
LYFFGSGYSAQWRATGWWPTIFSAFLFVLIGSFLMPYPGLQEDEMLFASPVYKPETAFYRVRWRGSDDAVQDNRSQWRRLQYTAWRWVAKT